MNDPKENDLVRVALIYTVSLLKPLSWNNKRKKTLKKQICQK